ncbi:hypothetical protein BJ508DRAFT_316332 [Ascobolus immersus RN42]|uniref:Uncharacterized protein n=1 Tax=Ascobolus immersus RN42 TaxID=1160509 RepID=A0A3N4H6U5_ASCIM|nr:hypothetical protein BJ508DRAFT_316332 [Ascobolus immersus RN42]
MEIGRIFVSSGSDACTCAVRLSFQLQTHWAQEEEISKSDNQVDRTKGTRPSRRGQERRDDATEVEIEPKGTRPKGMRPKGTGSSRRGRYQGHQRGRDRGDNTTKGSSPKGTGSSRRGWDLAEGDGIEPKGTRSSRRGWDLAEGDGIEPKGTRSSRRGRDQGHQTGRDRRDDTTEVEIEPKGTRPKGTRPKGTRLKGTRPR